MVNVLVGFSALRPNINTTYSLCFIFTADTFLPYLNDNNHSSPSCRHSSFPSQYHTGYMSTGYGEDKFGRVGQYVAGGPIPTRPEPCMASRNMHFAEAGPAHFDK